MDSTGRAKRVEKQGVPDCRWTKWLDPVISANLPKDTIRIDNRAKQLQEYWLDAVTPLIAALENVQEGTADLQDATKAMQEALWGMPRSITWCIAGKVFSKQKWWSIYEILILHQRFELGVQLL